MKKDMVPWKRRREDLSPQRPAEDWFLDLHRQMNELFDSFHEDFGTSLWRPLRGLPDEGWMAAPSVDVTEDDKEITVTADLPGLDEKDISVTLDGDALVIQGEKSEEHDEKKRRYHIMERRFGRFQRAIPVPEGVVDEAGIKAAFKKGVLKVTLPKRPEKQAPRKTIDIKVEE
ncbi:MAG: Hsp20/alpha crystallin family protein [Kiritimatiellae bacterium]|nr:Hsp20/alpha crystallin family protein [Kiritimatiellia bacterium]